MHTRSTPEIYLKPGEYYFGGQPAYVHTVLGSCVAVSIFHPPTGLAAICHAVHPECALADVCKNQCPQLARYVNCVVPSMIQAFLTCKAKPADMVVKLFGGGAIIGNSESCEKQITIGAMNISAARQILQYHRLRLDAIHVGGDFGRKIILNTQTGTVLMKRIQKSPLFKMAVQRPSGLAYKPLPAL